MPIDLGTIVNRNGAGSGSTLLDGTERFSSSFYVGNAADFALWVKVTATSANLTNVIFKLYTSYDETNWVAIYTTRASTAATAASHTVTASAGSSVVDWLHTTNNRLSMYARIGVQATLGGAIGATEIALVAGMAG